MASRPEPEVPERVAERPAELADVVSALVDARAGMAGITTGLYGVGGFGETVLAKMACEVPGTRGHAAPVTQSASR